MRTIHAALHCTRNTKGLALLLHVYCRMPFGIAVWANIFVFVFYSSAIQHQHIHDIS